MDEEMAPADEAPEGADSTAENLCPECGGSGRVQGAACEACGGSGEVNEAVGGG